MARIRIKSVPWNRFAFGGNLGTNGADFTDGLTYFNVPTRHETNPNGGIPQGIAPDGKPNLVEGKEEDKKSEGGEIKWNKQEYIFSDRLKPTQALIDKWKLPKAFLEYTYADAVRKSPVVKEAEQRPNDVKSQDTMDLFLADVANDQEEQKAQNKAAETQQQLENMSPQELAQMNMGLEEQQAQQQAEQQAMLEQQIAQEQAQQQQASPEAMQQGMPQQGVPQMPMMGAEGGHLHAEGGTLAGEELDNQMIPQEQEEQIPPQENPSQETISQEPVEDEALETEDTSAQFDFNKDAEDMSTNELNAVIDQIIDYAINNNDRDLARQGKKVKRESRERKEDFVNESLDSIKAQQDKQNDEQELQAAQQPSPGDELAAQEQGPVAEESPENIPQEAMNMFGTGGDLQEDIFEEFNDNPEGQSYTEEQLTEAERLGIKREDLYKHTWDDVAKTWSTNKALANFDVIASRPIEKPTPYSQDIPVTTPMPLQDYMSILTSQGNPYVQEQDIIRNKGKQRQDNMRKAQELYAALQLDEYRKKLLGQPIGISANDIENGLFSQNQFGKGGHLNKTSNGKYTFTVTRDGQADVTSQEFSTPEEAFVFMRNRYSDVITDDFGIYRDELNANIQEPKTNEQQNKPSRKQYGSMRKIRQGDTVKWRYYSENGTPGKVYNTFKELLDGEEIPNNKREEFVERYNQSHPDDAVSYYMNHTKNGKLDSKYYKNTGYYVQTSSGKKAYIYKNQKGQEFFAYEDGTFVDSQTANTLRNLPAAEKYTGNNYSNDHNQYTWTAQDDDGNAIELHLDSNGNVLNEQGEIDEDWTNIYKNPDTRTSYTYKVQASNNGQQAASQGNANTQSTSTPSNVGQDTKSPNETGIPESYKYDDIRGFQYWNKNGKNTVNKFNGQGDYDEGYRNFINKLTDLDIQAIKESQEWKEKYNEKDFSRYTSANGDLNKINAEMLKGKRGALDYANSDLHKYAALLYTIDQERKANADKAQAPAEKSPVQTTTPQYVIRYWGDDGKARFTSPKTFTGSDMNVEAVEGIYNPEIDRLEYLGDEYRQPGTDYRVFTLPSRERPSGKSHFTELEEAFIRACNKNPDDYKDEEQIRQWKKVYADAINRKDKVKPLPTWGRYAPLFDIAEAANAQPALNTILGTKNELTYIDAPRHGEYIKYNPVDGLYRVNQIQNEINAGRKGIINAANGNRGLLMANLALQNSKGQQALGEQLLSSELENQKRYQETVEQHNKTDQIWDQLAFEADRANMSNNSIIAQANRDAANIMWDEAQDKARARNATRTGLLQTIHNIGKDNFVMNQVNSNPAFGGYGISPNGVLSYFGLSPLTNKELTQQGLAEPRSQGGCLTIKRKRRSK